MAIKRVRLPGGSVGHDRFRTKIIRQTVIWAEVAHPNILPFIGYQIVDSAPMLVLPWCENGNILDYIHRHPNLTRNEKIDLVCHAARGLLFLHTLNPQIVHGHIKPENVIVQDNLVAAFCDFDDSKIQVEQASGLTTSGRAWGEFGYQAKELLNGDEPTPPTDVYAFGGLILIAMSGKRPFWKLKPSSTLIAVFTDRIPVPADHPQLPADDPLWGLLAACWSAEPEARPSMSTVLQKLEGFTGEEESLVQPGYFVFNSDLPKPIPGKLIRTMELAQGGFGDVFQGLWVRPYSDPVAVVIKCVRPLDKSQAEKFGMRVKRETLIWGMVKHRNILPFLGYQIVDGVPMLVSPWCKNGNLEAYTKAHPELTRGDKIELLCGAARGLLHLHSLSPPIYHGDIKPQNIIVQDSLEAMLCDFGISRIILEEEQHTGWTTSEAFSGTIGFLPKELIDESRPTTAADVYAFSGVILATMSGQPPFWKKKYLAKILAISTEQTPNPVDHSEIPEKDPLWTLMRECWSPAPESRPHTADLLNRLEAEIPPR